MEEAISTYEKDLIKIEISEIQEWLSNNKEYYDSYDIMSELYIRNSENITHADNDDNHKYSISKGHELEYFQECVRKKYPIFKNSKGLRENLKNPYNADKIVRLLNIKATIIYTFKDEGQPLGDDYYNIAAGYESGTSLIDAGYY